MMATHYELSEISEDMIEWAGYPVDEMFSQGKCREAETAPDFDPDFIPF